MEDQNPSMQIDVTVFKARNKRIWNYLLVADLLIIIFYILGILSLMGTFITVVVVDLFLVFLWFAFIRERSRVEIFENVVRGPSPFFAKAQMLLAEIDQDKTFRNNQLKGFWLTTDIHSVDGKHKIRMLRMVMGRRQIRKILTTLQDKIV